MRAKARKEGLVALLNHDDHLDVDDDKADELPNKASSHEFDERCGNHRLETRLVSLDIFFD